MSASVLSAALMLMGSNMQLCEPQASPAALQGMAMVRVEGGSYASAQPAEQAPAVPGAAEGAALLAPSASATPPGDGTEIVVSGRHKSAADPIEVVNVKAFQATRAVDEAVFRPISLAYAKVMPNPARRGLRNILNNLGEPSAFVNFLLQHKIGKAAAVVGRFAINSTIGIGGLIDVAKRKPFNIPRRQNGFANTLGFYGVKQGAFVYVPLLGPMTVRDLVGFGMDRMLMPIGFRPFAQAGIAAPVNALNMMDRRMQQDEQIMRLRATADAYTSTREFYLKRRQAEIDALHVKHGRTALAATRVPATITPVAAPAASPPAADLTAAFAATPATDSLPN